MLDHFAAQTFHGRKGAIANAFRYRLDYVLTDFTGRTGVPVLSRNRLNLWSLWDRDHGGPRGQGGGVGWFRQVLHDLGAPLEGAQLLLLAQPRFLWFSFSPVSFWLLVNEDRLIAFIAEVNNTVGQRHCYFCAHPDFRPIGPGDVMQAQKLMYVSPFQPVSGGYRFRVSLTVDRVDVRIDFTSGSEGVFATLRGKRTPATTGSLIAAALRRPLGPARVLALIHWQALRLALKRAPFRRRTAAPDLVSHNRSGPDAQHIAGQ